MCCMSTGEEELEKSHSKLRDDITETESLRYEFADLCWKSIKGGFSKGFEPSIWKQLVINGNLSPGRYAPFEDFGSLILVIWWEWVGNLWSGHDSPSLPPHLGPWPKPRISYEEQLRKYPWIIPSLHSSFSKKVLSSCIVSGVYFFTNQFGVLPFGWSA